MFEWLKEMLRVDAVQNFRHRPKRSSDSMHLQQRSFTSVNGNLSSVPATRKQTLPENTTLALELSVMRGASRWYARESGLGPAATRTLRSAILGSKNPVPSFSRRSRLTRAQKEEVLALWNKWSTDARQCDYYGQDDLLSLLYKGVQHIGVDGEMWFRKRGGFPIRIEAVDPGRVPVYWPGERTVLGVRFSESWRRTHVLVCVRSQDLSGYTSQAEPVRASNMLQWAHSYMADQVRGIPILWPAVGLGSTLSSFMEAAAKNAELMSKFAGVITEDDEAAQSFQGTDAPEEDDTDDTNVGTLQDTPNMRLLELPPGINWNEINGQFPDAAMEPFARSITQTMAASAGVTHFSLSGDLKGVNFSAGRLGLLDQREAALQLRSSLNSKVLKPLFRSLIARAIQSGALSPMSFDDAVDVDWPAPPALVADQEKQAKAYKIMLESGLRSRRSIVEEMGLDPEKELEEILEEENIFGPLNTDEDPIQNEVDENAEIEVNNNDNE